MYIKLYQINMSRDKARMCFESIEFITAYGETVRPEIYDEVFKGDVDCANLEALYCKFNADDRPGRDQFRSLSVSDVVAVCNLDTGEEKFYFCDSINIHSIDAFDFPIDRTHEELRHARRTFTAFIRFRQVD